MATEWQSGVFGLIGIALSIIAFVNRDQRLLVSFICTVAIVFYIINRNYNEVEAYEERISALEQKLKIHAQLIDIKSDIEYLKSRTRKKNYSTLTREIILFMQIVIILIALYLILKGFGWI